MSAAATAGAVQPGQHQSNVYLTFDDGPDADWTPRVLDMLAAARVPATFFMIGRSAQALPGLVRRVLAEGHAIGNHTWSHRHPLAMSTRQAREEVRSGAQALADVLGCPVKFYRPPHGRVRQCMVDEAARLGQSLVLWTLSAVDWGPFGSSRAIAGRLRRTEAEDIVLMHDGSRGINRTAELFKVLPQFMADLRHRGLQAGLPAQTARIRTSLASR